jgi:hypothetical protein
MQSYNVGPTVAAGVWILAICIPGGPASAQEPPTLDQIILGIERTEQALFQGDSLLIRYERTKIQKLVPSSIFSGFLLAEWTVGYKGSKWFIERRFTQPMKTESLMVPSKRKTLLLKSGIVLHWDQDARSASVAELGSWPTIYGGLNYTRNLSLDAPKYMATSNGADIRRIRTIPSVMDDTALPFLPEFLHENRTRYSVSPTQEKVNDRLCWVVEWPGMDRFWVDPERGFSIPRRAYCWAPGKPRRFEFLHSDYREVKPGLWLPFNQTEDVYTSIIADKESLWGMVAARSEIRLHAIEFDDVPDALFEVQLPPGTRVMDAVRNFQYTTSPNNEANPFDAAIAEAMKLKRQSILLRWLLAGAGVLVLVLIVGYWVRMRRRPAKPTLGGSSE